MFPHLAFVLLILLVLHVIELAHKFGLKGSPQSYLLFLLIVNSVFHNYYFLNRSSDRMVIKNI